MLVKDRRPRRAKTVLRSTVMNRRCHLQISGILSRIRESTLGVRMGRVGWVAGTTPTYAALVLAANGLKPARGIEKGDDPTMSTPKSKNCQRGVKSWGLVTAYVRRIYDSLSERLKLCERSGPHMLLNYIILIQEAVPNSTSFAG